MHILFTIRSLSCGGAERVTVNLSNKWIEKGYQVTILTLASKEDDFYELDSKINRIDLNLGSYSTNPYQAIIANIKRIISIRNALKKLNPDIVIGMMPVSAVLTIMASIGLHKRVIACERNYPPVSKLTRLWSQLRKITYPKATVVTAQTNEIAKWIISNIKIKKIEVIPNPIIYPLPRSEPTLHPVSVIPTDKKLLLSVGRLEHIKGFDLLISAFSNLEEQFPNWNLVIIGEGKERNILEDLIKEKKLQNRVLLPGRAGNIADWYNRADLFVMSSRSEGFPNVLAEAMSMGCPVVSYDCPTGPSELIIDRINGLLVNPVGDVYELESNIRILIENEEMRRLLSARAEEIRFRYSIDVVSNLWEKVFEDII
jgi:glycosyltransferase involved in cell wall biosynthesis